MAKIDGIGALLEVEMSQKCTPLWREAHLEVKSCKTPWASPIDPNQYSQTKSINFIDFEPGFFNRKPTRNFVENQ